MFFFTDEVGENLNQQLEDHEKIIVKKISIHECFHLVKENQLQDSELCYALLQAILKGFISID
ncbi:hypothetical protein PH210_03315 [Paenibacillus sp. BSR1-1]|uniref:hypothetical protein n=1 Tax=Paenibacillus sp. BSR1-1 TaxID=3020845 RepID=UPI0025AFFA84|nr:hypothetical protein [Paenibacillus sp. BSR1-1]MDN3015236.1 hypothetical protein [Paenibacillus sp. BSR1-1]